MSESPRGRSPRPVRRVDAFVLAAVGIPVLAVVLSLLVETSASTPAAEGPAETPLTSSTLLCPGGGRDLAVASSGGQQGEATVRSRDEGDTVRVEPHRTAARTVDEGSVVVSAEGDLAPGLLATRFDDPLAAAECAPPVFDTWFTGLGAGAKHKSVLQLVNPDAGRAIVTVTLLARRGVVDVPAFRGIAVPGGQTRTFDLAKLVPRRDDLALHVVSVRGRVGASVRDQIQLLGAADPRSRDAVRGQAEPAEDNLLLGLPRGSGQRTLVLANPGDDEGRAGIKLVTGSSTFSPEGLDDVRLPPQSVVRVRLTGTLAQAGGGEDAAALGVQVSSTVPTTATLVMDVDGDLAHATPTEPLQPDPDAPAVTPLPGGDAQLVIGGATRQGVVVVSAWDADGEPLEEQRVAIGADRAATLDLPAKARLVSLEPRRTEVDAVVLSSADGTALLRPRVPTSSGPVPQVDQALPEGVS